MKRRYPAAKSRTKGSDSKGAEPTATEQAQLSLYLRLLLSYSDFKHAYRCAQYLTDQEPLLEWSGGDDLPIRAIYSSLIVSYARPLNSAGTSRAGPVPQIRREVEALYSEEELKVHNYLLHLRNRLIAHSDAAAIDAMPFVASDLPGEFVIPEKNDAMAPFTPEFAAVVRDLAQKALRWCVEERHRLEPLVSHMLERKDFAGPAESAEGGT